MKRYSLFDLFTSALVVSSVLIPLPSAAAKFSTFSDVSLTIFDFTILPTNVNTIVGVDALAIADQGEVDVIIEGDTVFFSDQETDTALGDGYFSTSIIGKGTDFLGETYVTSTLIGHFFIPAHTPFSFGIQSEAFLGNKTSNLTLAPLSSLATIKLTLRDVFSGQKFTLIDFYGGLNTNDIPFLSQDKLMLSTSPDLSVTGSQLITQFGGKNESLLFALNANYQFTFDKDTKLVLNGTINTCNFASNTPGVCVNVPEPSTKLGLIASILFFFSVRMKKQIGEFFRQPFTKHFFKNFLLNIKG